MRLAVIIPAHDEAAVIARSVRAVRAWADRAFPGDDVELVVSENGSSDATRVTACRLLGELPRLRLIVSSDPGKGGAVKRAASAVAADAYLFMDADLSTDLGSAAALVAAVRRGADLAAASRRLPSSVVLRPAGRRFATSVYAALAGAALDLGVRDLQCGCKAFSRRVRDAILPAVASDGFFFDTELIARVRAAGFSLEEIGVRWVEPSGRRSTVKVLATGLDFLGKLAALRAELRR